MLELLIRWQTNHPHLMDAIFSPSLDKLKSLSAIVNTPTLSQHLVGLDWASDEQGNPLCSFIHPKFLEFAKEMKRFNSRFGFRVHYGESLTKGVERLHVQSAEIVVKCLNHNNIPFRIGHGVQFLHYNLEKEVLELIVSKSVVEVNLTSNDYLVELPYGDRVKRLYQFYKDHITLCTDNDGIWPTEWNFESHVNQSVTGKLKGRYPVSHVFL